MTKKGPSFLMRTVFSVAGATLGALAVLVYLSEREQREGATRTARIKPSSFKRAIKVTPPEETEPAAPADLPLKLSAKPRKFVRRKAGTIQAQTLAGASCIIAAKYSTGRGPAKLDTTPAIAGVDGVLTWTWDIGTSGTYVDVTVTVEAEGYDATSSALRVNIGD